MKTNFFVTRREARLAKEEAEGTGGHGIIKRIQMAVPQQLRWFSDILLSLLFDREGILKMDTDHFTRVVKYNCGGDWTFQEAFDRTGRIINITVAPLNRYDPPRLLNYLTAPHVVVWSAAVASCAVPGIFDSTPLWVKEADGEIHPERATGATQVATWSDGSIEADLPMQQLSELFNTNHFIVSQVNPHAMLLSNLSFGNTELRNPVFRLCVGVLRFLKGVTRQWLRQLIDLVLFRRIGPTWGVKRGLTQLLVQDYEGRDGDVTIMPWRGHISAAYSLLQLVTNPTWDEFRNIMNVSERATWPHMGRIKVQCGVELALERCVQVLRRRVIAEGLRTRSMGLKQGMPSFYASASAVRLSGLSVADPSLVPARQPSGQDLSAVSEVDDNSGGRDADRLATGTPAPQPQRRRSSGGDFDVGADLTEVDVTGRGGGSYEALGALEQQAAASAAGPTTLSPDAAAQLAEGTTRGTAVTRSNSANALPDGIVKSSYMSQLYYAGAATRNRSDDELQRRSDASNERRQA